MPKFVKYRGAGRVPVKSAKIESGQKKKKDPIMDVTPRKDWINPGEKIPIHRKRSKIYTTSKPIPRRKNK